MSEDNLDGLRQARDERSLQKRRAVEQAVDQDRKSVV